MKLLVPFQRNHEFVQSREFAPVAFLRMLALEALQCLMWLVREGAFPSIHLTLTCCSKASCKLSVHQLRRNVVENLVFFFLFGVFPVTGFAGFTAVCPHLSRCSRHLDLFLCLWNPAGLIFFLKVFGHQVVNSQTSHWWVFTWLLWHLSWHICDGTLEQCSDIHLIVLGKERVAQSSHVAWVMHAEDTHWHLSWILNPWTRHESDFRFWICIDVSWMQSNTAQCFCCGLLPKSRLFAIWKALPTAFHNIPWMTSHTTFVLCKTHTVAPSSLSIWGFQREEQDPYATVWMVLTPVQMFGYQKFVRWVWMHMRTPSYDNTQTCWWVLGWIWKESIFVYKTPTGEKWGT